MKRLLVGVLPLAAILLLAGCATTKPIWFIATPGYVESRIESSEAATREHYEAEISRLQAELDEQRQVSQELAALAEVIGEVESRNAELFALADVLEVRLENLPAETIRQLVVILQEYLDGPPVE